MTTPTPDFCALCAELVDLLDCFGSTFNIPIETSVVTRARAALATPPPEPPTDDELLKAVRHLYKDQISANMGADDDLLTARTVLDRWGK